MRGLKVLSGQLQWKFFHCSACRLLRKVPGKQPSDRATVNLAYATYQQQIGEDLEMVYPLIIQHGMMGSRANWHTLARMFTRTGRKVVTVDARNHGESPHTESMTYYNMRDDLLRVMDHLNIEKAVLLGHSMGGKASMTTALTYPDRVSGLIVEDVAPTDSPSAGSPPAFLQSMLKISLTVRDTGDDVSLSTARQFAKETLKESIEEELVRDFLAANLVTCENGYGWRINLDAVINNFEYLSRFPDFIDEQYDGPTLFVGGEKSKYLREEMFPEILRLFPTAEVEIIQDAGHWVHFDQPILFSDCVNKFLTNMNL